MLSGRLSFTSSKDRKRWCSVLYYAVALTVQCFYLWINTGLSVLLSFVFVAVTFHKNEWLNLGNHYRKNATKVAPGIIEKFEKPLVISNIIPQQIDETLKEQQFK